MRNIIKLATLLDKSGNYNLADKLDRIAQGQYSVYPPKYPKKPSNSYSVTGNYSVNINNYKQLVLKNDIQGATNYFNAVMNSSLSPQQKGAFRAQAQRIRLEESHGEYANYNPNQNEIVLRHDNMNDNLKYYKLLDTNIDKKEFDRRWKNMMSELMYKKWSDGKYYKDKAYWNQQMNLTYNMLTQKFKK